MGGGETCYGHAKWRAGDIIETHIVTKFNGSGLAPVLSADTDFQIRTHSAPVFDSDPNEAPNPIRVKNLEGVVGKDTTFEVRGKETSGVVPAEAVSGLGKVICAE
jgi:hypothetical protein